MWRLFLLAAAVIGCLGFGSFTVHMYYAQGNTRAKRSGAATDVHGGDTVSTDPVPYQLALEKQKKTVCGASIISKKWALTAAHCVQFERPQKFRLRSGSAKLVTGGDLHRVVEVAIHPNFNPYTLDFDVAVLRVEKQFNRARIINLAAFRPATGTTCTTSGWGSLTDGYQQSDRLSKMQAYIFDQAQCRGLNSPAKIQITDRMLCAGYPEGGKDACQGDSGGPLVVGRIQVGVVSQGKGCSTMSHLVYTDVAVVRKWIKKRTGLRDMQ